MSSVIVVPCYNEAARWRSDYWRDVTADGDVSLLFVNDGSTDATQASIDRTADAVGARTLVQPVNRGKSEAIRVGMLDALDCGASIVGYVDADGAFPAGEVVRLAGLGQALLQGESPEFDALWSARVLMGGRDIQRHASRHYIGRVIATVLSPLHRYAVYDTQSGYKLFAASDEFRRCLLQPFATRWFPDVELLMRWNDTSAIPMRIWEEPVTGWHDVAGSKMNRSQYGRIMKDLAHLVGHRRAAAGGRGSARAE